jgi:hypothetical protein
MTHDTIYEKWKFLEDVRNMGVGATGTLGQGWTIHGQQYSTLQKLAVDLRFQSLHQN